MSCRSEGERVENHRPALMASLSSIVRMGSSIVCLLRDWVAENCRLRDPVLLVTRCFFVQKGRYTDASIDVMQIFNEVIALLAELMIQGGAIGLV
jgi:hypothetical protein